MRSAQGTDLLLHCLTLTGEQLPILSELFLAHLREKSPPLLWRTLSAVGTTQHGMLSPPPTLGHPCKAEGAAPYKAVAARSSWMHWLSLTF